jgi:hypothetical protein
VRENFEHDALSQSDDRSVFNSRASGSYRVEDEACLVRIDDLIVMRECLIVAHNVLTIEDAGCALHDADVVRSNVT